MTRSPAVVELGRRASATASTSALAAIYLGGALAYVLSAAFPLTARAPVLFFEVGAAICLAAAPLIFLFGERWASAVLPVGILGGTVLIAITVAGSQTNDGTALSTIAFQWLAIYLAYFLPWRVASLYMATAMVALNVALAENEFHWERHTRVAFTLSFVAIFALLAWLVDRLRSQATRDQLTGLFNRNGLFEEARARVPRSLRRGEPVTLCAIDLDDFKAVNDEVGHIGADRLLVSQATHWREALGDRAIVARYGGDEFVIIYLGLPPDEFALLLDGLRSDSPLAWSAGCAELTDITTIEATLAAADVGLYQVKTRKNAAQ